MARHPLFQILLVLQNTGLRQETLAGVTLSDLPIPQATAKFDLLWNVEETQDGGLSGTLEYASDLYDARTARDWSGRLLRVLEQVTQAPDREIVCLDLLLQGEREHLLAWGHGPQTSLPSGTAGDWIAAQTQRTPDSVALEFGEETWTYRRLDEEAARLARHLTALEVGRDVVVGISTSRGPWMVVAMLAIWKAGGA